MTPLRKKNSIPRSKKAVNVPPDNIVKANSNLSKPNERILLAAASHLFELVE